MATRLSKAAMETSSRIRRKGSTPEEELSDFSGSKNEQFYEFISEESATYFTEQKLLDFLGFKKSKFRHWKENDFINKFYSDFEKGYHVGDVFMALLLMKMSEFMVMRIAKEPFFKLRKWFETNSPNNRMVVLFNRKKAYVLEGEIKRVFGPDEKLHRFNLSDVYDELEKRQRLKVIQK